MDSNRPQKCMMSVVSMTVAVCLMLSQSVMAQTGVSERAPAISFYAALGEDCCGEDPHPVHGIGTSDGGVLIVGKSARSEDEWGGFAVKIGPPNPVGVGQFITSGEADTLKWSIRIGRANSRSALLNAVELAGAIFVTGLRDNGQGLSQMYLAKHGLEDGRLIWEMELANQTDGRSGAIEVIQSTPNGGLIAGGITDASQSGLEGFKSFGNPYGGRAELLYFSADIINGAQAPNSPTWRRGLPGYETVKSVHPIPGPNAGYIVLVGSEGREATVVRTDAAGDVIWQRTYQGRFEATDLALHYRDGEHLGYTFTGHGGRNGTLDGQLTRIDLDGRQVWAKSFGNPAGGVGPFTGLGRGHPQLIYDECWGIQGLPDGGVVVGCGTGIEGCDLIADRGLQQTCRQDPRQTWRGWVIRFNMGGEIVWDRLDSFPEADSRDRPADAASEYVAVLANGGILSVVDQGFGIGVLVLNTDDGLGAPIADQAPIPDRDDTEQPATDPNAGDDSAHQERPDPDTTENRSNEADPDQSDSEDTQQTEGIQDDSTNADAGCQTRPGNNGDGLVLVMLLLPFANRYYRALARSNPPHRDQ